MPIAMEAHNLGVSPADFKRSSGLRLFYNVLATAFDKQSSEYISMIEAYRYPIYGAIFHPEMNPYEWYLFDAPIPHSSAAI